MITQEKMTEFFYFSPFKFSQGAKNFVWKLSDFPKGLKLCLEAFGFSQGAKNFVWKLSDFPKGLKTLFGSFRIFRRG
jgi:hypothetical protein